MGWAARSCHGLPPGKNAEIWFLNKNRKGYEMPCLKSIAAAGIFAALTVSADTVTPLAAPAAPFVKAEARSLKAEIFSPEINGDRIVSGNKSLQIGKDGVLRLFTGDGSKPVSIMFGYKTGIYGSSGMSEKKDASSNFDKESRTFSFSAEYPMFKHGAGEQVFFKISQKVTLAPDGLVNVSVTWDVPEQARKDFKGSYIWIRWEESKHGEKVLCAGQERIVRNMDGEKYWWFAEAKKSGDAIEFFPDRPDESFILIPKEFGSLLISSRGSAEKARLDSSMSISAEKGSSLSLSLDIRRAVAAAGASQNADAGMNFKGIDDLETPDYSACRNLIPNPSFETGFLTWSLDRYRASNLLDKEKWKENFFIDSADAAQSGSSLKIRTFKLRKIESADFAAEYPHMAPKSKRGNEDQLEWPEILRFSIPLEPGKHTLSYYAKASLPGKQLASVTLWNSGVFNRFTPTDKWERYKVTFDVKARRAHQIEISAMQKDIFAEQPEGFVWIDGIQLEKGDQATDFVTPSVTGALTTSAKGNFLKEGDKIDAALNIISAPDAAGTVKVSVKDFFGEKRFEDNFKFKCGPDGRAVVKLPFDGKFPQGIFVVKAEYNPDGGKSNYEHFRFSIMKFLENKHRLKDLFVYTYGNRSYGMSNCREVLGRWKKIGAGGMPGWFDWSKDIYDVSEEYGFSAEYRDCCMAKTLFKFPNPAGPGHLFCMRGAPGYSDKSALYDFRWDDKNAKITDGYLQKLKAAAKKNAEEAPWVKHWCFLTEDGAGEQLGLAAEEYTKLLKACAEGIRAGNPNAKVGQGAPCNMSPLGGIREIDSVLTQCDGKVKFDYIGAHIYRSRPEDPDLDDDFATLFKTLAAHGYKNEPVIIDEGGQYGPYNIPSMNIVSADWKTRCWTQGALSYDMGWTEKISAAHNARSWLAGLKYQDRVKYMALENMINNFALDKDLTPYASQKIPNTLGNLLGDACFKKDIRFAPYTRCYVFEDAQKRPVAAVWGYYSKLDAGTVPPFEASANFSGKTPEIFDLMEAKRSVSPDEKGNIRFPVSSFPLFFRGEPGSLPALIKAFESASLLSAEGVAPVHVASKVKSPSGMDIIVKNMLSKAFSGQLEAEGKSQTVSVEPSSSSSFTVPLPLPLSDSAIKDERFAVKITDLATGCNFRTDCSFRGFLCKKAKSPLKIDGGTDDWKDIPAVKFESRVMRDKNLKSIAGSDFSGWFKTAWDERGFYLCVSVTDDKFILKENQRPANNWNNDTLQVYFDTLCDARSRETRGYDISEYDYTVYPKDGGKSSEVYMRRSPDIQLTLGLAAPPDNSVAEDVQSAFKLTKDGYVYEVFFPSRRLLPAKMEKGYNIGFGLFVNDRDDLESKEPKSALTITPDGTGCYNNPHLWPVMLLWD
jgi:hypothetical protein